MELKAELFQLYQDQRLLRPVYAHQRFLLHGGNFTKLKVHVPTAGGKTLGALLFALRETFRNPDIPVRTVFTYPTNLLSRDQFEHSIIRVLIDWIGAEFVAAGVIDPVEKRFIRNSASFEETLNRGVPTYVFQLPRHLSGRDLYVTVITGEGLQHLFSAENLIELGRRKGTYLLSVLDVVNQHDHIILSSPDLLGYVAQRCYSVTANFYNSRWRDELDIKLSDHQVVVDEYHFYDPYTYLNIVGALEKLGATRWLCLSATGKDGYFPDAEVLDSEVASRDAIGQGVGKRVASYPIGVFLHKDEIQIVDTFPRDRSIYFYHSVITAHQTAERLRASGVRVTEWSGIQKTVDNKACLTVATSAAEVGLDLPFLSVHTEFWGNSWEISSVMQRIGRVGRSESPIGANAHIWITGREPDLLFGLLKERPELSKSEFGAVLIGAFGEQTFRPEDYISFYLWEEKRVRELRRFWQTPAEVSKLRFHFRPPNSQAVFDWNGIRFVYDWAPITNRYDVEKISELTDLPFWQEMGYSEWRVGKPREERGYNQRYEGRKDKEHRRLFWS